MKFTINILHNYFQNTSSTIYKYKLPNYNDQQWKRIETDQHTPIHVMHHLSITTRLNLNIKQWRLL